MVLQLRRKGGLRLKLNSQCHPCPQANELLAQQRDMLLEDCHKLVAAERRVYTYNHYYYETLSR